MLSQIAKFMGPTWVLSAPDGPHVGPMNLAIRGLPLKAHTWYDAPVAGTGTLRPVDEHREVCCVDSRDVRSITKHHVKGLLDSILHDWLRFPPEDLLPDFSKYALRGLLQMSCKDFSERSRCLVHGKVIISYRISGMWLLINTRNRMRRAPYSSYGSGS